MSSTVIEKPRVPTLKKIKGDENIRCGIPIVHAQFLIGKSWDVSLKLNYIEVQEKHCTIEKIASDVWTLVIHENASVKINDYLFRSGSSRILKCGDVITFSSNLMFQFKCSSLYCDHCNTTLFCGTKFSEAKTSSHPPKFDYEQLRNQNFKFVEQLQSLNNTALHLNNGVHDINWSDCKKLEVCKNFVESYENIFQLENSIDKYKLFHMKALVEIVTRQRDFIENLHKKINRFQNDFESVKDRSNHLEGLNQHLNNENVTLRTKIAQHIENAEKLKKENRKLQFEVYELKREQEGLLSTIDSKKKEAKNHICCFNTSDTNSSAVSRNCEAVVEVEAKLTKLLETEFKCTICNEIFVDAIVTNCGHTFCEHCLSTWKVIKPNCPICRCELTNETKSLAINSYLINIMPFASNELRSNWTKAVDERKKNLKSRSNTASKRKYFEDPFLAIDLEFIRNDLLQVYENLYRDNFFPGEYPIVDLTDDGAD